MIELIATIFSVAGSAGFGSALKLAAGFLQSRHEQKMAEKAAMNANVLEFQRIFSDGGMSKDSAITRRVLAVILILTMSIVAIVAINDPSAKWITFTLPEMNKGFSLLWGFISFPSSKALTVELSNGHIVLMYANIAAMGAGFYFTPAGRK